MGKKENRKVLVAHPLQQHSYRLAEALEEQNLLHSYLTTVYYKREKIVYKILAKILGKDNIRRMEGRQNDVLNYCVKTYYDILGLVYLFIIRRDKKKIIEPFLYDIMTNAFGKTVAEYCRVEAVEAVVMYDTTAYECFKKMDDGQLSVLKIIDMSSAAAPYICSIIQGELKKKDAFNDSLKTKIKSYDKNRCNKYLKEIEKSDYFLVPSTFVEKSLAFCGIEKNRIIKVPYGVDINFFQMKNYITNPLQKRLKFLFAGRVEAAKGIFYLLEAFKHLEDLDLELIVVGTIECDRQLLEKYKKNVNFLGIKTKNEMPDIFKNADIYIMPSLWEGFSLTIFEAMASGIPVIATKNSGAEGVVSDFEQGFVIGAASIEDIKEKVLWFYKNQDKIETMGRKARLLAEQYTWESYKKNVLASIKEILE